MENKSHIAIIGAGISGLSLAYFLKRTAGDNVRISVFEGKPEPGGTIRTVEKNGYTIEGGPNGFLDNRPATLELVTLLDLENELLPSSRENRAKYIYLNGKLRRAPENPLGLLTTDLLSFGAKWRVLAEPFAPPKKSLEDESLESFLSRRLGKEAVHHLADPVISGIYAGSTDTLSARATFPKLYEFEQKYGSLLKGLFASRKARGQSETSQGKRPRKAACLTSFKRGLRTLIDALSDALAGNIYVNSPVHQIKFDPGKSTFLIEWRDIPGGTKECESRSNTQHGAKTTMGGRVEYRTHETHETSAQTVILATPAYASAEILSALDLELAGTLALIPYAPVHVLALGFSEKAVKKALRGFGFLFARSDRERLLGCLWSSSIYPGRSPGGKILLRCLLGGTHYEEVNDLTDEELIMTTRDQLKRILGIEEAPELVEIFRYGRAIPQYTIGHLDRLANAERRLSAFPGLYLTGNAYRGISMNDCIEESKRLAERIVTHLSNRKETNLKTS